MFRKLIVPALAVAAATVAVPAAAQSYQGHYNGNGYNNGQHNGYYNGQHNGWNQPNRPGQSYASFSLNQRQGLLNRRIARGTADRTLTWQEAQRLRAEAQSIARLEASYRRNGLTQWEVQDLTRRFDRLEASIHYQRTDNNGRRY